MKIALAQINTTGDIDSNLEKITHYVRQAADGGARVVVFPEATMAAFGTDLLAVSRERGEDWREALTAAAQQYDITIVAGEFEASEGGRVRNVVGAYSPDGTRTDYAKIHLYDAFGYKESDSVEPGDAPVIMDIEGIGVGFATCYDIRFPKLFAELSRQGAEVIIVPASWGAGPGKVEQWKVLGRARALDSNCFIVALGQADPQVTGVNVDKNAPTGVGHSLVSDPFGHAVVELGGGEELQLVDFDFTLVQKAKKTVPILENAQLGY